MDALSGAFSVRAAGLVGDVLLAQKIVQQSSDWYSGHYDHLSPTLLATKVTTANNKQGNKVEVEHG